MPASRSTLRWCEMVDWARSKRSLISHTQTAPAWWWSTSTICSRTGSPKALAIWASRSASSTSIFGWTRGAHDASLLERFFFGSVTSSMGCTGAILTASAVATRYLTAIVPTMPGACTSQTYSYWPGWLSVSSNVSPSCIPPGGPEAKSLPGPEVLWTSCATASSFEKVIVSPALTLRSLGLNWMFFIDTAAAPAPPPPSAGGSGLPEPPPPSSSSPPQPAHTPSTRQARTSAIIFAIEVSSVGRFVGRRPRMGSRSSAADLGHRSGRRFEAGVSDPVLELLALHRSAQPRVDVGVVNVRAQQLAEVGL